MTPELPREIDTLDERLRALEDAELAARLAAENPLLYPRPLVLEPAPFVRGRRYGSIVLGIAVAVSLVASALLGPAAVRRGSPQAPVVLTHASMTQRVVAEATAAAHPQTAAPAAHATQHPAAVHASAPAHRAKTSPIGRRPATETQPSSAAKPAGGGGSAG